MEHEQRRHMQHVYLIPTYIPYSLWPHSYIVYVMLMNIEFQRTEDQEEFTETQRKCEISMLYVGASIQRC